MKKLFTTIYILLAVSIFAQSEKENGALFNFLSIKGTAISSIGHFKEAWEKGNAFYISYSKVFPSNWALLFQTGFSSYKENPEYDFQGDAKFNIIPLQVGGRYYITIDWISPFITALGGINIVSRNYTAYIQEEHISVDKVDQTSAHVNFQVGAGIAVKLIDQLQLEVLGMYNSHLLEPHKPYNITGLEFGAGINWVISH